MRTVTLPVKGLNFAGCIREIEKHLSKLVEDCGFPCGEPLTRFSGRGATGPLRPEAVHAHGTAGHLAVEDHAAHEKMEMGIVDHHIMGHDMSDPAMARAWRLRRQRGC